MFGTGMPRDLAVTGHGEKGHVRMPTIVIVAALGNDVHVGSVACIEMFVLRSLHR